MPALRRLMLVVLNQRNLLHFLFEFTWQIPGWKQLSLPSWLRGCVLQRHLFSLPLFLHCLFRDISNYVYCLSDESNTKQWLMFVP